MECSANSTKQRTIAAHHLALHQTLTSVPKRPQASKRNHTSKASRSTTVDFQNSKGATDISRTPSVTHSDPQNCGMAHRSQRLTGSLDFTLACTPRLDHTLAGTLTLPLTRNGRTLQILTLLMTGKREQRSREGCSDFPMRAEHSSPRPNGHAGAVSGQYKERSWSMID